MTDGASITVHGRYRDGQTARVTAMALSVGADGSLDAVPPLPPGGNLRLVRLDSRIAGLPATLRFPWGGVFGTQDHEGIEAAFAAIGRPSGLLHRLESRMSYVAGAVVFTVAFLASAYLWGVPALSAVVTPMLPASVGQALGEGALEQLDRFILEDSELDARRRDELTALFDSLHRGGGFAPEPQLVFRGGGLFDANAFALPDGTVILTDELEALATSDGQIAGVLLHELGHVQRRHSLRQLLNRSSVAALTFLVVGDVSTVSALIVALPTILLESSFTRDMEREADDYAIDNARSRGIAVTDLADILARLDRYHTLCRRAARRNGSAAGDECMQEGGRDVQEEDDHEDWTSYASTHPATAERIARIREAAGR